MLCRTSNGRGRLRKHPGERCGRRCGSERRLRWRVQTAEKKEISIQSKRTWTQRLPCCHPPRSLHIEADQVTGPNHGEMHCELVDPEAIAELGISHIDVTADAFSVPFAAENTICSGQVLRVSTSALQRANRNLGSLRLVCPGVPWLRAASKAFACWDLGVMLVTGSVVSHALGDIVGMVVTNGFWRLPTEIVIKGPVSKLLSIWSDLRPCQDVGELEKWLTCEQCLVDHAGGNSRWYR
jgi:hypothetical protein